MAYRILSGRGVNVAIEAPAPVPKVLQMKSVDKKVQRDKLIAELSKVL